jgi:hypothetical protein
MEIFIGLAGAAIGTVYNIIGKLINGIYSGVTSRSKMAELKQMLKDWRMLLAMSRL